MRKYKDLITGLAVFFLSLFYLINIRSVRVFTGAGATAINARTIPLIEGSLLMLLSVIMLIRYGINARRGGYVSESGKEDSLDGQPLRIRMAVPLTLCLLLIYVLAIGRLGFVLTSIIYLFFQIIILSPNGKIRVPFAAVIAVIAPVIIYLVFVYLLNVPLPRGIMPF